MPRPQTPHAVAGDDPAAVHQAMASTMQTCHDRIEQIQHEARDGGEPQLLAPAPRGDHHRDQGSLQGHHVETTRNRHETPVTSKSSATTPAGAGDSSSPARIVPLLAQRIAHRFPNRLVTSSR